MQHEPIANPCPAAAPDPDQDQAGRGVRGRIGMLLHTVRTLLGFGRHLAETAPQRAAAPNFTAIAVCFGTTRLAAILAHLNRGILRAMALERVLLARAAAGRDVPFVERRKRPDPPQPAPVDPQAAPAGPQAAQPDEVRAERKAARRPSRPAGWDDPELFMPTLEEMEAEVRRRPIGRTIVAICLDLGVVPGFCTGPFWNELFDVLRHYGGSLTAMMQERGRREAAFVKEQDRRPTSDFQWWKLTKDAAHQVMGFFAGEEPVNPFALSTATGPP